jgi:hypothetical protein
MRSWSLRASAFANSRERNERHAVEGLASALSVLLVAAAHECDGLVEELHHARITRAVGA